MSGLVLLLLLIGLSAVVALVYLRDPLRAWRRYRGERFVTCPETHARAAVSVDVGRAAFSALLEGVPDVRLASCSRWVERGPCDEPCLAEIEAAGPDGTVAAAVSRWCRSQVCAFCGRPIASPESRTHPAALVGPDGATVAWLDVRAERLPGLFGTHRAACWHCHQVETFRRTHKDLVVER